MHSNFKDSQGRAIQLEKFGIQYLDCGISGGVYGLERGFCLMVGGADHVISCAPIFGFLAANISENAPRTDPLSYATSAEMVGLPLWWTRWTFCKDGPQRS